MSTSEPSGSGARRKRFENGEADIDPDDDVLPAQLWAIKWKLTSRGQIEIESMDGRCASAVSPPPTAPTAWAYAFAFLDVPGVHVESHQGQSITGDLM